MKKILIIMLIFVVLSGCQTIKLENEQSRNVPLINEINPNTNISNSNSTVFFTILKTNKDGKDYLNLYPNTQVVNITLIEPQEFNLLQENTRYKKLYNNLPQKELYKVDFKSEDTNLLLTAIIDIESKKVINIIGIYVMGMGE